MKVRIIKSNNPLYCVGDIYIVIVETSDCYEVQLLSGNRNIRKEDCEIIPSTEYEGVHRTHCCVKHGCKYGQADCPVVLKVIQQDFPCEDCTEEDNFNTVTTEQSIIDRITKIEDKLKQQADLIATLNDAWTEGLKKMTVEKVKTPCMNTPAEKQSYIQEVYEYIMEQLTHELLVGEPITVESYEALQKELMFKYFTERED